MLCRNCDEVYHPEENPAGVAPEDPECRSSTWLWLCTGCGAALPSLAIPDLFIAKLRQLDALGLAMDPLLLASVVETGEP